MSRSYTNYANNLPETETPELTDEAIIIQGGVVKRTLFEEYQALFGWTDTANGISRSGSIGVGIDADAAARVIVKGRTNDALENILWLLNSDNATALRVKNNGTVNVELNTLWANKGSVFRGNVDTDGHIGRPSAQAVASNYGRPDLHGLISIENNYPDKESSLTFYGKLSDDTWRQTFSLWQSWVNYDNTPGAYHTSTGVHVPGVARDTLNAIWWDNNSSYLNAGNIDISKEHTLPPDDTLIIGGIAMLLGDEFASGDFTRVAGFSFENRIGNGWGRFANNATNKGVNIGYSSGSDMGLLEAYDHDLSAWLNMSITSLNLEINLAGGDLKLTGIQTNNVGLTTGQIYQGTAAEALANNDRILIIKV